MSAIRAEFDAAMAAAGGAGSAGTMARRRVVDFESACLAALCRYVQEANGMGTATITPGFRMNGHTLDYAVLQDGRVIMAVECRIGGMRSSRREAFDLVANMAMLTRKANEACLLLPSSAQALAESVQDVAQCWDVERLLVGIVAEGNEPALSVLPSRNH